MSRKTKAWLILAALLIVIGSILFVGVMTVLNWDFTKLSTNRYIEKQYDAHIVTAISIHDYGSIDMQHIEVVMN